MCDFLLRRFRSLLPYLLMPYNPLVFFVTPRLSEIPPSALGELETTAHMTSRVEVKGMRSDFFSHL